MNPDTWARETAVFARLDALAKTDPAAWARFATTMACRDLTLAEQALDTLESNARSREENNR